MSVGSPAFSSSVQPFNASSQFAAVIASLAPTRWYRLANAGAGTTEIDRGSDGLNATWSATGASKVRGMELGDNSSAALFDGTSGWLSIPTSNLPTGAQSFSVGMVMKILDLNPGGVRTGWLMGNSGGAGVGHICGFDYSTNQLQLDMNTTFISESWGAANPLIAADGCVLWCITYDGTTARLHMNGRYSILSAVITLALAYGTAAIGSFVQSGDFATMAAQDWFLIKGTVLTVAQLYNLASALRGN